MELKALAETLMSFILENLWAISIKWYRLIYWNGNGEVIIRKDGFVYENFRARDNAKRNGNPVRGLGRT